MALTEISTQLFGTGGKVTTDLNLHGDLAASVAVQADGKILAGGYA